MLYAAEVDDLIEVLKAQRTGVAQGTAVLESIISTCSHIAKRAQVHALPVAQIALGLRAAAIRVYAGDQAGDTGVVRDLLEEAIAQLENALRAAPRAREPVRVPRGPDLSR